MMSFPDFGTWFSTWTALTFLWVWQPKAWKVMTWPLLSRFDELVTWPLSISQNLLLLFLAQSYKLVANLELLNSILWCNRRHLAAQLWWIINAAPWSRTIRTPAFLCPGNVGGKVGRVVWNMLMYNGSFCPWKKTSCLQTFHPHCQIQVSIFQASFIRENWFVLPKRSA